MKEEDDNDMIRNEIMLLRNKIRKLEEKLGENSNGFNITPDPQEAATPDDKLLMGTFDESHNTCTKLVPSSVVIEGDLSKEFIGYNPISSDGDMFQAYGTGICSITTSNRLLKCSAFSALSLIAADSSLFCRVKYMVYTRQQKMKETKSKEETFNFDGEKPVLPEHLRDVEKNYSEMLLDVYGKSDFVSYNTKDAIRVRALRQRFGVALNFTNLIDDVEGFSKQILSCLPTKGVIWQLIDIYLSTFNAVYPVLELLEFIENVSKIIGPHSTLDVKLTELKIERRMDFATLGILLIVLRFGYLSIMVPNILLLPENETIMWKSLKANEIGSEFISLAKKCSLHFDILKVTSIDVFKLTLLLKLYCTFAPEEGDRGSEQDRVLFSKLVHEMACGLGLDKTEFLDFRKAEMVDRNSEFDRTKNLHNKLWWIVYDDGLSNSLCLGKPLEDDIETLEFNIPSTWALPGDDIMIKVDGPLIPRSLIPDIGRILDLIKSSKTTNLKEITRILENVELKVFSNPRFPLDCFFNLELNEVARIKNLKFYLAISNSLISILFIIYTGYLNVRNSEFAAFYLKKMTSLLLFKIFPVLFKALNGSLIYFPKLGDLTLIPDYMAIFNKLPFLFIGTSTRFLTTAEKDKSENRMYMAKNIISSIKTITMHFFKEAVKYGPKYFSAWQCAVDLKTFIDVPEREDFRVFINEGEADFFEDKHVFEIEETLSKGIEHLFKEIGVTDKGSNYNQIGGADMGLLDNTVFDTFLNTVNVGDFHFDEAYMERFFNNFMDEESMRR